MDCLKNISCRSQSLLLVLSICSIIFGFVLGLVLRYSRDEPWSPREVMYVGYVGELYIRALKGMIIPLILSSIITAIGSLDLKLSKRIGIQAIAYYIGTTFSAVILGVLLVTTIKPGKGSTEQQSGAVNNEQALYTPDILMDLTRNLFPPNIIQATFEMHKTYISPPDLSSNKSKHLIQKYNLSDGELPPKHEWPLTKIYVSGLNIIGLLVFATALSVALAKMAPSGRPLLEIFKSLSDASMIIIGWIMWISPLGILSLIASVMIQMDDFSIMLGQVGMYVTTVLTGIAIHGLIVLPGIFILLTRKLPFRFIGNMSQAFITAFATSSSAATLPITLNCIENINKIDSRITRFVLPIGATINMDATALDEAVAVIFIAQVRGMSLNIGHVFAISLSATMASIGAAAVPGAGLAAIMMVLDVIGLPAEDISYVIAVNWILDRFRTVLNVLSDSLCCGIIYERSKKELNSMDTLNGNKEQHRKPSLNEHNINDHSDKSGAFEEADENTYMV
ncbi:unnamed protein product [Meganyctiphanes norvegica]|uniref:Amino acid transporter n=1 Tax=Meganyctiphanes norvegica TaxID=48144 RepID=A0AAV2R7Y2_MEGNR